MYEVCNDVLEIHKLDDEEMVYKVYAEERICKKIYKYHQPIRTMRIKCPKCKSTNTISDVPKKMHCKNCSHVWTPYKHRGKKFKTVGNGITSSVRKTMPGVKTMVVGGNGITHPIRIKIPRKYSKSGLSLKKYKL